jgi:hypothetical protein
MISKLKSHYHRAMLSATVASLALMSAGGAIAQVSPLDLTQDQSGGKKASDLINNIDSNAKLGAGLLVNVAAISGFCIIILSLFILYRAGKEDRDAKPKAAIVGIVVGGALAAVGSVMWMIRNGLING